MPLKVPASTSNDTEEANADLYFSVKTWLKKHGKVCKHKITERQKADASACFRLMDTDGSGQLDLAEMDAAFKLLGLRLSKRDLEQLMNDTDQDGDGSISVDEFLSIMTTSMTRQDQAEGGKGDGGEMPSYRMPFGLMSAQYKRKRLLEGILGGSKGSLQELVSLSEKQQKESMLKNGGLAATRVSEVVDGEEEDHRQALGIRNRTLGMKGSKGNISRRIIMGKAVKRLSEMNNLDDSLSMSLSKEQLGLLVRASDKKKHDSALCIPTPIISLGSQAVKSQGGGARAGGGMIWGVQSLSAASTPRGGTPRGMTAACGSRHAGGGGGGASPRPPAELLGLFPGGTDLHLGVSQGGEVSPPVTARGGNRQWEHISREERGIGAGAAAASWFAPPSPRDGGSNLSPRGASRGGGGGGDFASPLSASHHYCPPSAPATSASPLSATDEQLLQMPQANLSLYFTHSIIKGGGGGGGTPRSSAVAAVSTWNKERQRQQQQNGLLSASSSPRRGPDASQSPFYGAPQSFGASSPHVGGGGSMRRGRHPHGSMDAATHVSALVATMTPRSSREKALAYADGIEKPFVPPPSSSALAASLPRPATVGALGLAARSRSGLSFGYLPGGGGGGLGGVSPRGLSSSSSPSYVMAAQDVVVVGGGRGSSRGSASRSHAAGARAQEGSKRMTLRGSSPPSTTAGGGGGSLAPLVTIPMLQLSKIRLSE